MCFLPGRGLWAWGCCTSWPLTQAGPQRSAVLRTLQVFPCESNTRPLTCHTIRHSLIYHYVRSIWAYLNADLWHCEIGNSIQQSLSLKRSQGDAPLSIEIQACIAHRGMSLRQH